MRSVLSRIRPIGYRAGRQSRFRMPDCRGLAPRLIVRQGERQRHPASRAALLPGSRVWRRRTVQPNLPGPFPNHQNGCQPDRQSLPKISLAPGLEGPDRRRAAPPNQGGRLSRRRSGCREGRWSRLLSRPGRNMGERVWARRWIAWRIRTSMCRRPRVGWQEGRWSRHLNRPGRNRGRNMEERVWAPRWTT